MCNHHNYQQRWFSLLKKSPVKDALKNILYTDLRLQYAEQHRAYHTFEHIKACLMHFDKVSQHLDHAFEVELALWFHDVIYHPKQKSNELESALYANQQLQKLNLSMHCIQQVEALILITQHPSTPLSYDEKILVDIDLSILGAHTTVFAEYERNIRQEYQWVDDSIYAQERIKVLRKFLEQKRLYHSDYFFERKEQIARQNLKHLIVSLRIWLPT